MLSEEQEQTPEMTAPDRDSKSDDITLAALKSVKQHEVITSSVDGAVKEMHEERIKRLRKELLDYMKDTSWKYEPIETYIGQTSK